MLVFKSVIYDHTYSVILAFDHQILSKLCCVCWPYSRLHVVNPTVYMHYDHVRKDA